MDFALGYYHVMKVLLPCLQSNDADWKTIKKKEKGRQYTLAEPA